MNNEKLNSEDLRKLTKYQIRLATMKGGNPEQEKVYKYKINDYTKRLAGRGVNTQSGGVHPELERQANEARATINGIRERASTINAGLPQQIRELIQSSELAKKRFQDINTEFQEHVANSKKEMDELLKDTTKIIGELTEAAERAILDSTRQPLTGEDYRAIKDNLNFSDIGTGLNTSLNVVELLRLMKDPNASLTNIRTRIKDDLSRFSGNTKELINAYISELVTTDTNSNKMLKQGITSEQYNFVITTVLNTIGDTTSVSAPPPVYQQ